MKFLKWLIGILATVGGIIALFVPKSNRKIKKIRGDIKNNEKSTKAVKDILKKREKDGEVIDKKIDDSLNKVKELEDQKNKGLDENDDISSKEAADWLKDYIDK